MTNSFAQNAAFGSGGPAGPDGPDRTDASDAVRTRLRTPEMPLVTAVERARYQSDGYAILRHAVATHEVFILRHAFDELEATAGKLTSDAFFGATFFALHRRANPFSRTIESEEPVAGVLRRVTYPYAFNSTLDQFRRHPRILQAVRELLGEELVQVVNQANFNPPMSGAGWGWHQDYRFRKAGMTQPGAMFVQTLVALDPCTTFTGGLRVIPQSQRLGPLALDRENEEAEKHFDASRAVTPELMPGDMILFHPYLIHGSTANLSQQARRVYINGYAVRELPYGMPVLAKGEIIPTSATKMEYEGDTEILPKASKY